MLIHYNTLLNCHQAALPFTFKHFFLHSFFLVNSSYLYHWLFACQQQASSCSGRKWLDNVRLQRLFWAVGPFSYCDLQPQSYGRLKTLYSCFCLSPFGFADPWISPHMCVSTLAKRKNVERLCSWVYTYGSVNTIVCGCICNLALKAARTWLITCVLRWNF